MGSLMLSSHPLPSLPPQAHHPDFYILHSSLYTLSADDFPRQPRRRQRRSGRAFVPSLPTVPSLRSNTTSTSPPIRSPPSRSTRLSPDPRLRSVVHFVSGGLAMGFVKAVLLPLDTVKTRIQAARGLSASGTALFKGVVPGVAGIVPAGAVYMLVYQAVKGWIGEGKVGVLVGAGVADVLASLVRVPCEVVKQRLQVGVYGGLVEAVSSMTRGGIREVYSGLGAMLARDVPFAAVEFGIYESMKATIRKNKLERRRSSPDLQNTPPSSPHPDALTKTEGLLVGGVAGVAAALISNPMDVVKTRLMTQRMGKSLVASNYHGVADCIRRILKEEGLSAFSKGVFPRATAKAIQSALFFATYETLRTTIARFLNVTMSPQTSQIPTASPQLTTQKKSEQ